MSLEVNDTESILAAKRHRELISAINKKLAIETPPPDTSVADAIGEHVKTVEKLIAKLKPVEIPRPVINVETNNDEIIARMSDIADRISSSLAVLKQAPVEQKPREWTFTVTRNFLGVIETITAKAI